MSTLNIVAVMKSKPGKESEVESLLTALARETHKEVGCLMYVVNKSAQNNANFFVIEKWASQEALELHLSSSHIAKAFQIKDQLLDFFEINPLISLRVGHPTKESF